MFFDGENLKSQMIVRNWFYGTVITLLLYYWCGFNSGDELIYQINLKKTLQLRNQLWKCDRWLVTFLVEIVDWFCVDCNFKIVMNYSSMWRSKYLSWTHYNWLMWTSRHARDKIQRMQRNATCDFFLENMFRRSMIEWIAQ